MTRDEMKELANRMYAAANEGDLDAVDGIFAAAIREKYPEQHRRPHQ